MRGIGTNRIGPSLEGAEYGAMAIGMAFACSGFAMLAQLFAFASGWALVAAVVTAGVLCGVVSLSIGELASMFPSAPGVRTYFKAAFGDRASLALTFLMFAVIVIFAGVESFAFQAALATVLPWVSPLEGATLAIAVVAIMNVVGLEVPRKAQVLLACVVLVLLTAVSVIALLRPSPVAVPATSTSIAGSAAAVGGAVFLYTGFEWVTPLGRRPESYRTMIPWAMPGAIVALAIVFVLLTLGLSREFVPTAVAASMAPHLALGERLSHAWGRPSMVLVSASATLTTFNAGLMGGSRLLYIISRERRFFSWAGKLSMRTGAPTPGIIGLSCACWLAAAVEYHFKAYLEASIVCAVLYAAIYACFAAAALRLRRSQPAAKRPFRSPIPVAIQIMVGMLMALGAVSLFVAPSGRPELVWFPVALVGGGAWLLTYVFIPHRRVGAALRAGPASG